MNNARALSLGMGVLSLMAAAFAGFAIWVAVELGPRLEKDGPLAETAKSVTSASCESLQKICPLLASSFDSLNEAHRAGYRRYHELLRGMLLGGLGWGLLSGACFIYIFVKSRQPAAQ